MSNSSLQHEIEESGILSAMWILASNDENPYMLYGSTKFRLGLPDSYNLRGLIKRHQELFRLKCHDFRLEEWKQDMLRGKRLPIWVKEIDNKEERERTIKSLTSDDVFRSQFRAKADAQRSEIDLINWGLEHIERVRKAKIEAKEGKWKFLKEGIIPIVSILVALIAVIVSSWIQYINIGSQEELKKYEIDSQKELKKYEVSFKPRIEGYTIIMQSLESAFESARNRNKNQFQKNLGDLKFAYYQIKPFLSKEAQENFLQSYNSYNSYLNKIANNPVTVDLSNEEQEVYKRFGSYFGETLYEDLFEKNSFVRKIFEMRE